MSSERPIPLMLFSNATVRAGAEEVVLHLLRGLDRNLFRLHLACPPQLAGLLEADLPRDVELSLLSLDYLSDFRGAYTMAQCLRRHNIQILHSHMFRASLFASPIARLLGVPVILDTAHGREFWRTGWKASFAIDRFVARQVHYSTAVSDATARYLIDQKRIPAGKVKVIRNGVELRSHPRTPELQSTLKRSLNVREDCPLLIVIGRLEPQKGHRFLLEAMPSIRQQFPTVQLVCLGEGSLRRELERMVDTLQLAGSIRFLGYDPDVSRWFAGADLSILPSLYEGLPMAALESLAAECPIVATAVDGTPEIVVHEKTGLLVPPRDPQQLANAVLQMLHHPERARKMAARGRKHVLEEFSVQQMVHRTEILYLQAWREYLEKERGHQTVAYTRYTPCKSSPPANSAPPAGSTRI
jgi:glycosyltransferase involved in cell wall biosynthesis